MLSLTQHCVTYSLSRHAIAAVGYCAGVPVSVRIGGPGAAPERHGCAVLPDGRSPWRRPVR